MKELLNRLSSLIWPERCPVCGEITVGGQVCDDCKKEVSVIAENCTGCGCPIDRCSCSSGESDLNLTAPFEYDGKIKVCLQNLKFHEITGNAPWLAEQMSESIKTAFPEVMFDICTCVPLTRKRLNERGYNQSALLCKHTARYLEIPYDNNLLTKTRNTFDQHELKKKDRIKNLKGAFSLTPKKADEIKGKTVLLIDDIKTTGTTLKECRKVLLKAGAKDVFCACAAVTTLT